MNVKVGLKTHVLENNRTQAAMLREKFAGRTLVVNMTGSPGAGKTSILEKIIPELKKELQVAVIEGDVQTSRDAERIAKMDVPAVQINTMGGCHLDAKMIAGCIDDIGDMPDILFIENVGNLVCPAEYDLGEDFKMTVLSIPEGEDKPLKYPGMFRNSKAVVMNKVDLLQYMPYDIDKVEKEVRGIQPDIHIFRVGADAGSAAALSDWLKEELQEKRR